MKPKQVHLSISCDEGHVADSLRQIANAIEGSENVQITEYETSVCMAEIDWPE